MYFVMTGQQLMQHLYTKSNLLYLRTEFSLDLSLQGEFFPNKIFRQTILKDHDIGVRCYYLSTTPLSHFVKSSL